MDSPFLFLEFAELPGSEDGSDDDNAAGDAIDDDVVGVDVGEADSEYSGDGVEL